MSSIHQTPASFRDGLEPRPTDVFIAVMGVTGAGKSTFISRCCEKKIAIGHNLQACTKTVDVYPCQISGATTVYLIDTPGFDDTSRSDTEVLREIATWLTDSYTAEIRLSGIIYLHRISDIRMQGSAKKNLFMFKKLCGPNALKNVILATTMWDRVSEAEGLTRERELISTPDFWGWMVSQGSKVYKLAGDKRSAFALIRTLMRDNARVTLDLQQQMVNEKKTLDETDAGKEVQAEIVKERKKFEKSLAEAQQQMAEALQARDEATYQVMKELQDDYNDRMWKLEASSLQLKVDMEKLHREKYDRLEARLKESLAQHQKEVEKIKRDRKREITELAHEKGAAEERERKALEALRGFRIQKKTTRTGTSPKMSLAITGNSYFFRGPKKTIGVWTSNNVIKNTVNSSLRILALGEQESWLTLRDDGKIDYSSNMEQMYPGLVQRFLNTDWGHVSQIVLGSAGAYFVRGSKESLWKMNKGVFDDIKRHSTTNPKQVSVCALGRSDSYILQWKNGQVLWDLQGHYGRLDQWLTMKSEFQNNTIAAAALSLTNDDFVVVYDDGAAWVRTSDAWSPSWENWVTRHYGTVFV